MEVSPYTFRLSKSILLIDHQIAGDHRITEDHRKAGDHRIPGDHRIAAAGIIEYLGINGFHWIFKVHTFI